jgi:flavin-dependent dehydrogenase
MRRVVVIGAGVGGLTAAALLARTGLEVTVLEAHVYPGGCSVSRRPHPGPGANTRRLRTRSDEIMTYLSFVQAI